MEYTKENIEIAKSIFAVLAKNKCTVEEASAILSFVGMTIRDSATVQVNEKAVKMFTYDGQD